MRELGTKLTALTARRIVLSARAHTSRNDALRPGPKGGPRDRQPPLVGHRHRWGPASHGLGPKLCKFWRSCSMRHVLLRGNRRCGTVCTHTTNGFCLPDIPLPLACVCWLAFGRWNQVDIAPSMVCMHVMCLSVLNPSPFISRFSLSHDSLTDDSTSTPPTIQSRPSSISTKRTTNELNW